MKSNTSGTANLELHRKLRLRAALFSCHEKSRARLKEILYNSYLEDASIHFHAYLCEYPRSKSKSKTLKEYPKLIDPFIDRGLFEKKIIINTKSESNNDIQETITTVLKNIKNKVNPFENCLKYMERSRIFEYWNQLHNLGTIKEGIHSARVYDNWLNGDYNFNKDYSVVKAEYCIEDMKNKLNSSISLFNKLAYLNLFLAQYQNIIVNKNDIDCLYFVSIPIYSINTFYGIIIATIECPNGVLKWKNDERSVRRILDSIKNRLKADSENIYFPTLVLTQNSWEEMIFDKFLDSSKNFRNKLLQNEMEKNDYVYATLRIPDESGGSIDPNILLENKLAKLWENRINCFRKEKSSHKISNSLKFKKMMIASPGLISVVRQITLLNLKEPKEAPLPSILIYAPPGAGKENIARIIPLFSDFYWDKERINLNMGSILLEMKEDGGIKKLLSKLAKSNLGKGAIIVLDELNSLDIKEQPILLRILEQGELESIKDYTGTKSSKQKIPKWLFIGIINEEPENLTLEHLREKTLDKSFFGQFLSVAFYEYFKEKSRLRDDIYYRIRRSGEIKLEGLENRREDIPIIFYFMVKQYLSDVYPEAEIFLTLDSYKLLTDKSINWRGNIRKLENIVRVIKGEIEEQYKEEKIFIVDSSLVQNGLDLI